MLEFLQRTLDGWLEGSAYALVGLGLTLTFGTLRRLNLAYGATAMLAAYVGAWLFARHAFPAWGVALVVVGLAALIGIWALLTMKGGSFPTPMQTWEAAVKLFSEDGYYTTTIQQIARQAGISTGLIYQYFRDKDDILFLSLKMVLDTYERDIPVQLEGLRRQDGIHAAAVVITRDPLTEYLPIQRKPESGQDPEDEERDRVVDVIPQPALGGADLVPRARQRLGALAHAGRREQAIAPHHIHDFVFLARIGDSHLVGTLALLVGIEHQPGPAAAEALHGGIGELLPPLALMRGRLRHFNREHAVEQQHALLRPMHQRAM